MKIKRSTWWNLHSHSRYSINDAMPEVEEMVATVAAMGQPALGLTDHGNMAGSAELYSECMKAGIKPFPGTELYVVNSREDKKAKRHHMCAVAYTSEGYENLVNLSTTSYKNFYHKPLIDMRDLAQLSEAGKLKGIAATSGCYFGLVSQSVVKGQEGLVDGYLKSFDQWFDKFYVELQSHNIDHDDGWSDQKIIDKLIETADRLGLPCVITQDAHYTHLENKHDHETLKRLVAFGPDSDDAVFPGDGFHLASDGWIRDHHTDAALQRGLAGLGELLELHELRIPELDSYSYSVPFTVADPERELKEFCENEIAVRGLGDEHRELLAEEIEVIEVSRMAGYLLLVKEVTDHCKEENIFQQTRGSASGSLVCWLLGITQFDPIAWGLRYERFISRDRTKPPDIDLDIEHTRRQDVIDWLNSRYAVTQIGTYSTYSLSGTGEDTKGSLRVKYLARQRKMGTNVISWSDVPVEDRDDLQRLSGKRMISSYGVHPAGLLVTAAQQDIDRLVPMMYVANSKTFVTQYDGKTVEKMGLMKLDILGLHTLSILNKAIANLGKSDLEWIPFNDKDTFRLIRSGRTDGIFQLEGPSSKRGVKQLKPTKIKDIIDAMALFRTAIMKSGETENYIERKHNKQTMPKRHPLISSVTDSTQGIMLFQEQVIEILRVLEMDLEDLNSFMTAIKASNKDIGGAGDIIAAGKETIHELCNNKGMSDEDFVSLWTGIEGFAEYGFNKAHSTAYGVAAYRCAYLATHFPIEFYAAVLNINAGTDKEAEYLRAVRGLDIRVKPADINVSGTSYEVDKKRRCIRKGFLAVKGVGEKASTEIISKRPEGGYKSIKHFCESVEHRKVTGVKPYLKEGDPTVGVLGALTDARAFQEIDDH